MPAELRPGYEVPPSTSLAFGAAFVQVDGATLRLAVAIANLSRETFVADHIHRAVAGVNGPVVVPLFSSPGVAPRLFFQAGPVAIDPALGAEICGDPRESTSTTTPPSARAARRAGS
ncbi:MAG TPA: CHRD domain-containing protein [Gaiellaceae bacterium]|nr:CHRD domain-containing protein [Gaiellaceae bacterium]